MNLKGKYYVEPPENLDNLKEIFLFLAQSGVGRRFGKDGLPPGPWSPELLATAISEIDANKAGVDVRTVQRWFQMNDHGIKSENIRWLALVFGCGDSEATRKIQVQISAADERLRRSKRQNRKSSSVIASVDITSIPKGLSDSKFDSRPSPRTLANRAEAAFHARGALNLPILIWAGLACIWFVSYIFGIHEITYSIDSKTEKQVGFFWSPSWTIGDLILLPMFLVVVSELLGYWKSMIRPRLAGTARATEWLVKVQSFSLSYWSILFICAVMVFLVQWVGVYLIPLAQNDPSPVMIDWMLVATERPELVSARVAMLISCFAFILSGLMYWFYFVGLLLVYTVADDFAELADLNGKTLLTSERSDVIRAARNMCMLTFRCTVLGVLLAITIKLNAAYLVSDASSVMSWLLEDAAYILGFEAKSEPWHWLGEDPSPFFTSFLLLLVTCFVFFASTLRIATGIRCLTKQSAVLASDNRRWVGTVLVVLLLVVSFTTLGQFYGFSIFLLIAVVVSVASFIAPLRLV